MNNNFDYYNGLDVDKALLYLENQNSALIAENRALERDTKLLRDRCSHYRDQISRLSRQIEYLEVPADNRYYREYRGTGNAEIYAPVRLTGKNPRRVL